MNEALADFWVDDQPCAVHQFGTAPAEQALPLFVMPVAFSPDDTLEGQHMRLDDVVRRGEAPPFRLVTFVVHHWGNDLSPWPASSIFPHEPNFAGNAPQTLDWLAQRLIPAVGKRFAIGEEKGIVGGSLGGLFALWAIHETNLFTVCGSCSGSLWYEGFIDYLQERQPQAPCHVYLCLGAQEEKTRTRLFRQVGDATRRAIELLQTSPMTQDAVLEWFPGGHSGHTGRRLAAAQLWMAQHTRATPQTA